MTEAVAAVAGRPPTMYSFQNEAGTWQAGSRLCQFDRRLSPKASAAGLGRDLAERLGPGESGSSPARYARPYICWKSMGVVA